PLELAPVVLPARLVVPAGFLAAPAELGFEAVQTAPPPVASADDRRVHQEALPAERRAEAAGHGGRLVAAVRGTRALGRRVRSLRLRFSVGRGPGPAVRVQVGDLPERQVL